MVWLLPAAGSARFLVIVTLAWIVGIGGSAAFAHVIAGSVEVIYAVIASITSRDTCCPCWRGISSAASCSSRCSTTRR
ncbi:hypothetical protein [Flavisphingopyxis soli]|uniref:hypothetical protein n=1 Tax=Flavisphingopyxis soli TaxID=2601267 RepID=UPI0011BDB912|nr:hypothetical protein [Sphingorhabdus soli]